jgi:hypothetical protein
MIASSGSGPKTGRML